MTIIELEWASFWKLTYSSGIDSQKNNFGFDVLYHFTMVHWLEEWCRENLVHDPHFIVTVDSKRLVLFEAEEDAVIFRMKWF